MLPKHVNPANCVPDPHGRKNHVYHEATDEVFHVDRNTHDKIFKSVEKAADKAALSLSVVQQQEPAETGLTLRAETPPELSEQETPEDTLKETVDAPDRAELLQMAESLELTVPEGLSDVDLLALIEKGVQE